MLDFFYGAHVELQLASLIQLTHLNYQSSGELYSITFAIITLLLITAKPFLVFYVLYHHSKIGSLESDNFKDVFGSLTS